MNYELKQTKLKNGKFHYQVIDEAGNVISERKSNREYVACTIKGGFYFGRLDLIGKGDYGRVLNYAFSRANMTLSEYEKMKALHQKNGFSPLDPLEQIKKEGQDDYDKLKLIAYKKS